MHTLAVPTETLQETDLCLTHTHTHSYTPHTYTSTPTHLTTGTPGLQCTSTTTTILRSTQSLSLILPAPELVHFDFLWGRQGATVGLVQNRQFRTSASHPSICGCVFVRTCVRTRFRDILMFICISRRQHNGTTIMKRRRPVLRMYSKRTVHDQEKHALNGNADHSVCFDMRVEKHGFATWMFYAFIKRVVEHLTQQRDSIIDKTVQTWSHESDEILGSSISDFDQIDGSVNRQTVFILCVIWWS